MDNPQALIVEDDKDAAVIFVNALQDAGFECEIIGTGDKALARLAETTPSVVILDLELPHVSGIEILHHIRADARLAETCVIVATAYPDLAENLRGEADLVLIKPVGYGQLRDLTTVWKAHSRATGSQEGELAGPYKVAYDSKRDCIKAWSRGEFDEGVARELVARVAQAISTSGCKRVLIDLRESELTLSTTELYYASRMASNAGILGSVKRAAIVPEADLSAYEFFEVASQNVGKSIKVFTDPDEARRWLMG